MHLRFLSRQGTKVEQALLKASYRYILNISRPASGPACLFIPKQGMVLPRLPATKMLRPDGPSPGKFVTETHGISDASMYIQQAALNGKSLNVPKFHHSAGVAGGSLVFEMMPKPDYTWGIADMSMKK